MWEDTLALCMEPVPFVPLGDRRAKEGAYLAIISPLPLTSILFHLEF